MPTDSFAFVADIDLELLASLTETDGPPGNEGRVRDRVVAALEPATDRIERDAMGNVVATVEGGEPAVLVAAHMDEVGLVVRHVTEAGFLRVEPAGLFDPRVLRAQRVTVHTRQGSLPGVVGAAPPHTGATYRRDRSADDDPSVHDLAVDLGLPGGPDAIREHVSVGDFVTVDRATRTMGSCLTGKALDNRVSVYALVEAARALADGDGDHPTVHFAATVQEEVGYRGARALGVDIDPDLALNVDTTVASDVPDVEPDEYVTRLGEGAAIKRKDARVLPSPAVSARLRSVAEERGIATQAEVMPGGGTDTGELQYGGGATPVGAISVPTRYLHSPAEVVHGGDLRAVVDLLTAVLETEDGSRDYAL